MASVIPESLVPTVAAAGLICGLLGLLVAVWAVLRLRRLSRRLAAVSGVAGATAVPLDTERIDRLGQQLVATAQRLEAAETNAQKAVQRIGVVRYNPFEDTGSNQSFVLAMLDARGDGFVLSTLHSRQATRMFLKQVSGGKADAAVSAEEAEALRLAAAR
jgi:hypothetical protein